MFQAVRNARRGASTTAHRPAFAAFEQKRIAVFGRTGVTNRSTSGEREGGAVWHQNQRELVADGLLVNTKLKIGTSGSDHIRVTTLEQMLLELTGHLGDQDAEDLTTYTSDCTGCGACCKRST